MKTKAGDNIRVVFTSQVGAMSYAEPAWWGIHGRNPDVAVAGPCRTRRGLENELKAYALEGRIRAQGR